LIYIGCHPDIHRAGRVLDLPEGGPVKR